MADTSSAGAGAGGSGGNDKNSGNAGQGGKDSKGPWTEHEFHLLALQGLKQMLVVEDKRGAVKTKEFRVGARSGPGIDKAWKVLKDTAKAYQIPADLPAQTPRKTPVTRAPGGDSEGTQPAKKRKRGPKKEHDTKDFEDFMHGGDRDFEGEGGGGTGRGPSRIAAN